jgi:hypothetical protein
MMNERQILEMLSYLKSIDEKLEAILGMLQKTLRHSDHQQRHPDILDLPDRREGVPESGA